MNASEQEIEGLLRRAPAPKPPAGLRDRLVAQIQLGAVRSKAPLWASASSSGSWLGRWWPALAPAAVSMACAVVVIVEQMEIRDLKQTVQSLSQTAAGLAPAAAQGSAPSPATGGASEAAEIARLQELVRRLTDEVARLQPLRAENEKLRGQLAGASTLTSEDDAALAAARDRDARQRCANNLRQLGISVRVWAQDSEDLLPPERPEHEQRDFRPNHADLPLGYGTPGGGRLVIVQLRQLLL